MPIEGRKRVVVDGSVYFVDRSHVFPYNKGRCIIVRLVHSSTPMRQPNGELTWINPKMNVAKFYEEQTGRLRDRKESKEKYVSGEPRGVTKTDYKWFEIYRELFYGQGSLA